MVNKKTTETSDKRLYKIKSGKMINGVCQGFAEYFGIDVTLVRIIFVIALFIQGVGAVVYLLAMIFVPEKPNEIIDVNEENPAKKQRPFWIGAGLVVGGVMLLMRPWRIMLFWPMQYHWMHGWGHMTSHSFWPMMIIAMGVGYLIYVLKHDKVKKDEAKSNESYKWKRVQTDKLIGGVLGGLAKLWSQDVILIRVGFIVLAWLTHPFIWLLAYAVLYSVLPKESDDNQ